MPIRASGSFRRYLTPGLQPALDDDELYSRLREHRFRSIDDEPLGTPSVGWVEPGTFAASDFRPETVFYGPVLRLRMRIDQKKLPANAVKLRLFEALRSHGGRVAKAAKDELRTKIEEELLARTVPGTKLIDAFWRYKEQTLLLAATSANAHDLFTVLFKKTFGQMPEAATPMSLAERLVGREIGLDRLRRLSPFSIVESA
jgi:DNA recombination-dependent growth factor C